MGSGEQAGIGIPVFRCGFQDPVGARLDPWLGSDPWHQTSRAAQLDTYVPNAEHNNSNKFFFIRKFNKLSAPARSLP